MTLANKKPQASKPQVSPSADLPDEVYKNQDSALMVTSSFIVKNF